MSEYARKYSAAMAQLSETTIWPSNYRPPLLRAMRIMKLPVRPPHYAPFWSVCLSYSLWFGPVWGIMMWFAAWRSENFTPLDALGAAAFAGALFGISMAAYYSYGRRRWKLSRWADL